MTTVLLCALFFFSRIDLYVSPSGNDGWPGTENRPFRTVERAANAVKGIIASRAVPPDGLTVWIHGGIYELRDPLRLAREHSGTANARVVFRSVPGETVRVLGGKIIDPRLCGPITEKSIAARLQPAARPHVLEIDLWKVNITDYGTLAPIGRGRPLPPAPLELMFNAVPLPLARYPDTGSIQMGVVADSGFSVLRRDTSARGESFTYTNRRHSAWVKERDLWLHGTFRYGGADEMIRVSSIDTSARRIMLAGPPLEGLGKGTGTRSYVALNIPEELDSPGEWYLDRKRGKIYFWPPSDPGHAELIATLFTEPIVSLEAASFITIRGLTIEAGRGIGLSIEGGEGVQIEDCTIRNTGTLGIMFGQGARMTSTSFAPQSYEGVPESRVVGTFQNQLSRYTSWDREAGSNHRIIRCEVYNTGSGGIVLGGGSKGELIPGRNIVSGCRIHSTNRWISSGWAGIIVDGCGNRVERNELFDIPCEAILTRGNDHLFELNRIHAVAFEGDCSSAWVLGGNPSDRGNVVRNNFFYDTGKKSDSPSGVTLDEGACGTTIDGNVFFRCDGGAILTVSGHGNLIGNNIFVECTGPAVRATSAWASRPVDSAAVWFGPAGIYARQLLESVDVRKPPYSTRYPDLRRWMDLLPDGRTYDGMIPQANIMEDNVIVRCPAGLDRVGRNAQMEVRRTLQTDEDPGFVNAAAMNFLLRQDSRVFTAIPGFVPIPFDQIGLPERRDAEKTR